MHTHSTQLANKQEISYFEGGHTSNVSKASMSVREKLEWKKYKAHFLFSRYMIHFVDLVKGVSNLPQVSWPSQVSGRSSS